jgi:prepilin-type N-terminal cleavage/methylation domain-containing protein
MVRMPPPASIPLRKGTTGFSLVELLVVIVVLAILAAIILPRYMGGRTGPNQTVRAPITRAHETVCAANLRTVRQAIQAAQSGDPDAAYPGSLSELRLPAEVLRCDVGGEAYVYDPQTGQVHCPHPGHEKF